jgi:predicted TIM-barrel fold metal-dependent hydrolase
MDHYSTPALVFTPFIEETISFPPAERGRLRALGDRILFGSDFPNIPHGYLDAMSVLTRLDGVDDAWLRAVLHDNAAGLFGLAHS